MVVEVEGPNIVPSALPLPAARIPEFERAPAAMPPQLFVQARDSRQDHGRDALLSHLVLVGERRTPSHEQLKVQAWLQDRVPGCDLYTRLYVDLLLSADACS